MILYLKHVIITISSRISDFGVAMEKYFSHILFLFHFNSEGNSCSVGLLLNKLSKPFTFVFPTNTTARM